MELSQFIFHKKNAFSDDFCDELLQIFDDKEKNNETNVGANAGGIDLTIKDTTEIDLYQHFEILEKENFFEKMNQYLSNHFLENLPFRYYFDANQKLFTEKCRYETCQVQKYEKGKGHYEHWHVEVENKESSKRIFSMILYLNDVFDGGETSFLYSNQKIKPTKGGLVIFPSGFPFVHCGNKPISNDKYIVSTWLVYDP